jgi:hypothetical protein
MRLTPSDVALLVIAAVAVIALLWGFDLTA